MNIKVHLTRFAEQVAYWHYRMMISIIALPLFFVNYAFAQTALRKSFEITNHAENDNFPLVDLSTVATILIDSGDAQVVAISAQCLAKDIELVTDKKPEVTTKRASHQINLVIAGTLGQSRFVDELIKTKKIIAQPLLGKWESFSIDVVKAPFPGVDKALVVVGSDRRGTAYGLFEISRLIGVSPWTWWADVKPAPQQSLFINGRVFTSKEPSVKYRGIFLNDEDWGLQPWAARHMDKDIKDLGPKAYARIFELMLRLRANTIWPAMHDSTKPFWFYQDNPKVADAYGIVIGSTHCDMMHRSNTFEWQVNYASEYGISPGEFRYDTNRQQVWQYWNDRVYQAKNYESLYTIGMRGVRDGAMNGPRSTQAKLALLDTVMREQRAILNNHLGQKKIPQIFCPYKEVLGLYNAGLNIPEDVTLLWTDDNYGYLRRLSTTQEQKRSGGSGIYYHLSYMGKPHDYLWLSSTSPSLISYEMSKAYQFGADRFWVVNVGDIKPGEMEVQFFLEMAYDVGRWQPEHAYSYAEQWARETFGEAHAKEIAMIKYEYYSLTQSAKAEHSRLVVFDSVTRQERIKRYIALEKQANALEKKMPDYLKNAYFEMIAYPVQAASLLSQKVYTAQQSFEVQDRQQAKLFSLQAVQSYRKIKALTAKYAQLENGKWQGMITDVPRDIIVYGMPPVSDSTVLDLPIREATSYDRRYSDTTKVLVSNIPGVLRLSSTAYIQKRELDGEQLMILKDLGLEGQSISRYPFTGPSFDDKHYCNAPYLTYDISLAPGHYELSIKSLPTRPINSQRKLRLALVLDNQPVQFVDVNDNKEGSQWSANVLRGFTEVRLPIYIENTNRSKLKVFLLDTGIVLNRFDIFKKL